MITDTNDEYNNNTLLSFQAFIFWCPVTFRSGEGAD